MGNGEKLSKSCIAVLSLVCPHCDKRFNICRSCYRNHRYCSKECSIAARQAKVSEYRIKYRQSEHGKLVRRLGARNNRLRCKKQKTVGDHTSRIGNKVHTSSKSQDSGSSHCECRQQKLGFGRCAHCGRHGPVVPQFCRRGYSLKRRSLDAIGVVSNRVTLPPSSGP